MHYFGFSSNTSFTANFTTHLTHILLCLFNHKNVDEISVGSWNQNQINITLQYDDRKILNAKEK